MDKGRIAIPSNWDGGIQGTRSEHFGHCDVFTLIDIENGIIIKEETINNNDHGHGGCMVPVKLLSDNNLNVVVVAGIGRRPLDGFSNVGIDVYTDKVNSSIKITVDNLINDKLLKISADEACSGGGNCH